MLLSSLVRILLRLRGLNVYLLQSSLSLASLVLLQLFRLNNISATLIMSGFETFYVKLGFLPHKMCAVARSDFHALGVRPLRE